MVNLLRRRLIRPLRRARQNRQNTSDTRRIRQNQQDQGRHSKHDENTKPPLRQTRHPHRTERTHRDNHRRTHVTAQHNRAKRHQDWHGNGHTHRPHVRTLRRRLRHHERQKDDERKLQKLRRLSHDGSKLHPVRITALRTTQRAEHQRLKNESRHKHRDSQTRQPALRHQLHARRNHEGRHNNEQRARVRRIGVLPLRDGGDSLSGKPHDQTKKRQQKSRDNHQKIGRHRVRFVLLPRSEKNPRQSHSRNVPAPLICRHRRSPAAPPDAPPHRQKHPHADHSYRIDPTMRMPGRAPRCHPDATAPQPR